MTDGIVPVSVKKVKLSKPWDPANLKAKTDYKPFWKQLPVVLVIVFGSAFLGSLAASHGVWGFTPWGGKASSPSIFGIIQGAFTFASASYLLHLPFDLHKKAQEKQEQENRWYVQDVILPAFKKWPELREQKMGRLEAWQVEQILYPGYGWGLSSRVENTDEFMQFHAVIDGDILTMTTEKELDGSHWAGSLDPFKRQQKLDLAKKA